MYQGQMYSEFKLITVSCYKLRFTYHWVSCCSVNFVLVSSIMSELWFWVTDHRLLVSVLISLSVAWLSLKIYGLMTFGVCRSQARMDGKTVIVTGCDTGQRNKYFSFKICLLLNSTQVCCTLGFKNLKIGGGVDPLPNFTNFLGLNQILQYSVLRKIFIL